jgi:hypothetical protein
MKKFVPMVALAFLATGCSTFNKTASTAEPLKSPTPDVTKNQTVNASGKGIAPATIDVPSWYIKAPASTEEYVWVTGTAVSNDLAMSRTKAMLDAQVQLADKLNGVVDAMTRQSKKDNDGTMSQDYTSQSVRKKIVETSLVGAHLEDSKIMAENRGYRTFVLVRYPMLDSNRLLRDKERRESNKRQSNSESDIDKDIDGPKPISQNVTVTPITEAPKVEMKLMEVDNVDYKKRRDAALQKPGAVVGQITVQ